MTLFSERYGYERPQDTVQLESMNEALRIGIYNVIYSQFHDRLKVDDSLFLCKQIWSNHWHRAIDEFPYYFECADFYKELKNTILADYWYQVYDLIEFVTSEYANTDDQCENCSEMAYDECSATFTDCSYLEDFRYELNETLQREHAGYRLVGALISPVTNKHELDEIDQALRVPDEFEIARRHLNKALELFSKRENPDYENTIKESISAVEAVAQIVSGDEKATLGQALTIIQKNNNMHAALIDGWKRIYGFTSDAGGIRHAGHSDDMNVDGSLAKYMLVSCSAFLNYLVELNIKSKSVQQA